MPVVFDLEMFDEICRCVCPHCRKGVEVKLRQETGEFIHETQQKQGTGHLVSHGICWANGFRKSRFAGLVKNG